jgi:exodeoxyribonuclease V gamma subunit
MKKNNDMIYSSNHLEDLCLQLSYNIGQQSEDIFGREIVVTQTAGMTSWLKTNLTWINGVIANIDFLSQDALMGEVYKLLTGENMRNNRDLLRFRVYGLLGNPEFSQLFKEVSGYYEGSDLKKIQLSGKIADLFDQYQLYRTEMIEAWENGDIIFENTEAEKWQKWLWERSGVESRATSARKMSGMLQENKSLIEKYFPRISIFGISIFTKFHLEFFKKLSEVTELNIYLCLPTGKSQHQNDLLVSLGTKASELEELVRVNMGDFDFIPATNSGSSSLNRLQNQILDNINEPDYIADGSVQINSCYTPIREAECLYNYLIDLFEKDRKKQEEMSPNGAGSYVPLKPGDIMVMTTDINKYAPFIKAVFRNAPVKIPFRISGAASNSEDSVVAAIEQILSFTEQDLTSEKVISLLEQKRIKERFPISDCDYIRTVVRKANIRFGRENRTEDDTVYVSWKYGLEKILLGYAMLTDEEYPSEDGPGLFPYRDAEAAGSHDLFRLKEFVDRLESVIDVGKDLRKMADWKKWLLEEVIAKMIYHDDFSKADRAEMNSIHKALGYIGSIDFEDRVPFCVFLAELESKLFTEPGEINLNTGNVTVSSSVPVRGIPFRVICFIGLDNDVFPRKDLFLGFDLLGENYQTGDRSKKENDKYIFLDAVLSARENLYLSYIGQNVKDNTSIPPSILIDTFTDYVGEKLQIARHPLHGFSTRYNRESADSMFTYLYGKQPEAFNPAKGDDKEIIEVSVNSFVRFFENPVNWYFENILGIKYEENDDIIPETELFGLDHLQEWKVKQEILKHGTKKIDSFLNKGIKEGQLPLKNLGRTVVEKLDLKISELKTKYLELTARKGEPSAVIDFEIDQIRISGTIDSVFGREYIPYAFSDRPKYMVRAWLNALILYSENKIDTVQYLYLEKSKDKNIPDVLHTVTIKLTDPQAEKEKLRKLIGYFKKGLSAPLKFTPDAADKVLNEEPVENIFLEEAEGNRFASLPPNLYLSHLYDNKYFEDFDIKDFIADDFKPEVYREPRFDQIREIAGLLNLSPKKK